MDALVGGVNAGSRGSCGRVEPEGPSFDLERSPRPFGFADGLLAATSRRGLVAYSLPAVP